MTRTRRGVRDYASRHFGYIEPDGRGRGLAECDESKVCVEVSLATAYYMLILLFGLFQRGTFILDMAASR